MSGSVHVSHISFGQWLRERRQEAGITRDDLAERTACSSETLQKIESGERRPSRQIALSLAELFHVPADEQEAFITFARALALGPRDPAHARQVGSNANGHGEEQTNTHAPWRSVHLSKSNLPLVLTTLIGREQELDAVCSLLRQVRVRLLTLTGPPGTGKTRMAIEVASKLLGDFEDGVYFTELAPLSDPAMVIPSIARTLELHETGGQSIELTLLEHIKDKRILLVLDNFEQVLDAGPEVVKLIQASPWIKVLITSREALHVRGERQYAVPPLRLPLLADKPSLEALANNPAVELFVERAQNADAGFTLTEENALDVAEVCINLDGLPLAIELAAGRVSLLAPSILLSTLGRQLEVLTGGARDLPPRQRTLRAAIEWSYDLLDGGHQQLFRRMAVFQGGRTLQGLEAVCNLAGPEGLQAEGKKLKVEVLDGVGTLLSSNLLQQREGRDGEPRFWILEVIHEYAREKLQESGEGEALLREHALYFMRLAEEAEPHMICNRQQEWLDRLQDDYDNIRAALAWSGEAENGVEGEWQAEGAAEGEEVGLRIGGAIWRFWFGRGLFTEGREHLGAVLAKHSASPESPSPTLYSASGIAEATETGKQQQSLSRWRGRSTNRAKALNAAGSLARGQGDNSSARALCEESLALSREIGDKSAMAYSLNSLGIVAMEQGDYTGARALYEESLALKRELGDKQGIASSLNNLGIMARGQGDYSSARALFEESLALSREIGDKKGIASSLISLGNVAYEQGDYTSSRALHEESLALCRELGDKQGIAYALNSLGIVAKYQGDYTSSRALHEESLALSREMGLKGIISYSLDCLGHVAMEQKDYSSARALYEESLALSRERGLKGGIAVSLGYLGSVTLQEGDYTSARALLEESLALSMELGNKSDIANSLSNLGLVAQEQGDYSSARALFEESLALSRELGNKQGAAACLAGLGGAYVRVGEVGRGTKLLGAVEGLLQSIGAVLDSKDRMPYERSVQQAREMLGEEAFERAWQEGQAMSMEEAINYALQES